MKNSKAESDLRALMESATPGPWEPGDVWLSAGRIYSDDGDRVEGGSATRCAFCRLGEPSWVGRMDINGTAMPAHRHRNPEPYGLEHAISSADGALVAYEGGGIVRAEDVQFAISARNHVPALLDDVASLRAEVAAARKFAGEMRDFCSPHGVAVDYADRLVEAMDRAKEGR